MKNSVRVANIGGIDIGIHYSWVLVFLLVAWTLAAGLFPQQYPGLGSTTYWVMGAASSLLLFVSVLIHELAHSFLARSRGLKVTNISLFIFGGVSNLSEEPRGAGEEFQIAVVGPLTSLVLAAIFWLLDRTSLSGSPQGDGILSYLAGINLALALFNLVPGFPLDGGRVLRAVLWGTTGSLSRATRIAGSVGRIIGFLFILAGLFMAFGGNFIGGIWIMLIGWFLENAAESAEQQTEIASLLRGVTVATAMNPRPVVVEPDARLSELVHSYVLRQQVRAVPVVEDGRLVGIITLNEVRSVPQEQWDTTPVRSVMTGLPDLYTTRPSEPLSAAMKSMVQHDVNQLPVVDGGRLVGIVGRNDVIRFMQVREELGMTAPEERRAA